MSVSSLDISAILVFRKNVEAFFLVLFCKNGLRRLQNSAMNPLVLRTLFVCLLVDWKAFSSFYLSSLFKFFIGVNFLFHSPQSTETTSKHSTCKDCRYYQRYKNILGNQKRIVTWVRNADARGL